MAERFFSRFGIGGRSLEPVAPENDLHRFTVMSTSINIRVRVARSRLAGEPADVLITPRLGQLGPPRLS